MEILCISLGDMSPSTSCTEWFRNKAWNQLTCNRQCPMPAVFTNFKLVPASAYVKLNTLIISCDLSVNFTDGCADRENCMAYVESLEVEKVRCCPLVLVRYVQVHSSVVHVYMCFINWIQVSCWVSDTLVAMCYQLLLLPCEILVTDVVSRLRNYLVMVLGNLM